MSIHDNEVTAKQTLLGLKGFLQSQRRKNARHFAAAKNIADGFARRAEETLLQLERRHLSENLQAVTELLQGA